MTFGCPICEFSDEDRDTVFDHIFFEHGEEATEDMRPIELGEFDDKGAGQCYVEKWKKEKQIEKMELTITPKPKPADFKKFEAQIAELKKQNKILKDTVEKLDKQIGNIAHEHAKDRQKIAVIESYLNTKKSGIRRDFGWYANELLKHMIKKIMKHKNHTTASMDYKEVKLCLRFEYDAEAYRMMREVMPLKHGDKIKFVDRGKKQRPRYLLIPRKSFADAVKSFGGYSPSLLGGENSLHTF